MIVVSVNKFPVRGAFSDKGEVVTTKVSLDFLAIARRMFRGDFCRRETLVPDDIKHRVLNSV